MRSFSDMLLLATPALLAILGIALCTMPIETGVALAPNLCWVMTLLVATFCPPAWPRWLAFVLGLWQDVLTGTPLAAQALLALVLVEMVRVNAHRQQHQLFRVRWLEATGTLVLMQLGLWSMMRALSGHAPPLSAVLWSGLVNGLWYAVGFVLLRPLFARMPGVS